MRVWLYLALAFAPALRTAFRLGVDQLTLGPLLDADARLGVDQLTLVSSCPAPAWRRCLTSASTSSRSRGHASRLFRVQHARLDHPRAWLARLCHFSLLPRAHHARLRPSWRPHASRLPGGQRGTATRRQASASSIQLLPSPSPRPVSFLRSTLASASTSSRWRRHASRLP